MGVQCTRPLARKSGRKTDRHRRACGRFPRYRRLTSDSTMQRRQAMAEETVKPPERRTSTSRSTRRSSTRASSTPTRRPGRRRPSTSCACPQDTVIDGKDVGGYEFSPLYVNPSKFRGEHWRDIPLLADREVQPAAVDVRDVEGKPDRRRGRQAREGGHRRSRLTRSRRRSPRRASATRRSTPRTTGASPSAPRGPRRPPSRWRRACRAALWTVMAARGGDVMEMTRNGTARQGAARCCWRRSLALGMVAPALGARARQGPRGPGRDASPSATRSTTTPTPPPGSRWTASPPGAETPPSSRRMRAPTRNRRSPTTSGRTEELAADIWFSYGSPGFDASLWPEPVVRRRRHDARPIHGPRPHPHGRHLLRVTATTPCSAAPRGSATGCAGTSSASATDGAASSTTTPRAARSCAARARCPRTSSPSCSTPAPPPR